MSKFNLPVVETERLILRPIRLEDAEDIFEYVSDPFTTKYLTFPTYTNIENLKDYITDVFLKFEERRVPCWYAMELKVNGKVIGQCDCATFTNDGVLEDMKTYSILRSEYLEEKK